MDQLVEVKPHIYPPPKAVVSSGLLPILRKKKPIKKISFSSLNLDNSNSFNGVSTDIIENTSSRLSKDSHSSGSDKHGVYTFAEINKRSTAHFTSQSTVDFAQLPAFFIEERKASIENKIEMHRKIMGKHFKKTVLDACLKLIFGHLCFVFKSVR